MDWQKLAEAFGKKPWESSEEEIRVMVECIRQSAQDTLAALHVRGYKIAKECND